jgi:phytoene dehydrogenase-like protein
MLTAAIIGSGPNGLSAAIVLAAAGIATTVFERNLQIGGACSTAETTLPRFRQDLGSSAYPMGTASPFFRSLPIDIPWIEPTAHARTRSTMEPPLCWNIPSKLRSPL